MKKLTTINHLKLQFQVHDFVKKTINQINKDGIGLVANNVVITNYKSTTILDDVVKRVINLINELETNSNLQQFIYKVDLNEKKWLYFVSFKNYKILAEEIIIREAQKIYLREMFSS